MFKKFKYFVFPDYFIFLFFQIFFLFFSFYFYFFEISVAHIDGPQKCENSIAHVDMRQRNKFSGMTSVRVEYSPQKIKKRAPHKCNFLLMYKARVVTKGYQKIQEINYNETLSPATMLKYVQILLAITTYFSYEIWKMDVKTTFLNGMLTDDTT
jgi:hypothetical protein